MSGKGFCGEPTGYVAHLRPVLRRSFFCSVLIIWAGGFIPLARSLFSSAVSNPDRVCIISLDGKVQAFPIGDAA